MPDRRCQPRRLARAVLGAVLLAGCGGPDGAPPPDAPPTIAVVPTEATVRDLTYRGVFDTTITLRNGRFEGSAEGRDASSRLLVTLADDVLVLGDLTGDGEDDGVVLLSANAGGSGVVTYVAVVSGASGQLRNIGTAALGDRVDVRSLVVRDGQVVLDLIVAGPEDPACCPSHTQRRSFRLQDGELQEVAHEDRGTISARELDGKWRLLALDQGDPVPDSIQVTLMLMDGQATGTSGCNRFTGPFRLVRGSQELTAGPFAGTRKLCPPGVMDVESRYLEALGRVERWEFVNGRLVLTYRGDDGLGGLVFGWDG